MNAATLAQSAYTRTTRLAPSAREAEYRLFAQITRDLTEFSGEEATAFPRLAEALARNQKLWARLATDVADAGNGLPKQLRAQIFSLAEFTRIHSLKVLRKEADASILVEVNTAMMRGLKGDTETAQ